ncbi:MAG: GGDEF domain-containing protein [Rhodoferax sp.]|nr:GGDEF domain-containing protein [Rhodoferax sp.]
MEITPTPEVTPSTVATVPKFSTPIETTHFQRADDRTLEHLRTRVEQLKSDALPVDQGWPHARGRLGELIDALREVTLAQQQRLRESMTMVNQLRAILSNASVGIIITRSGRFELLGQHACRMLGYNEDELLGQSSRIIQQSDAAANDFGDRVQTSFRDCGVFDGEHILKRKDGSEFWAHLLARGVVAGDPTGGTIWIVEDISDARAAREQLTWSATHDSLTLLPNRREFESRLGQAMNQFRGRHLCAMFIDLDHFKAVNDKAGHAVGDDVLREVAHLLEAQMRQSDTVARLGGDEFAAMLPGCSLSRAQQLAQQMVDAVQNWRLPHAGGSLQIGASIGVVAVTPQMVDLAEVLHAADTACYAAKRGGRGCVVTHSAETPASPR